MTLLLKNKENVIIIEARTTKKVKHVNELIKTMKKIKRPFPKFEQRKIYRAIATLKFHYKLDKYNISKAFFVIILHTDNFVKNKKQKNLLAKKMIKKND